MKIQSRTSLEVREAWAAKATRQLFSPPVREQQMLPMQFEVPGQEPTLDELSGWPSMLIDGAENPVFDTITILDGAKINGPVTFDGPVALPPNTTGPFLLLTGGTIGPGSLTVQDFLILGGPNVPNVNMWMQTQTNGSSLTTYINGNRNNWQFGRVGEEFWFTGYNAASAFNGFLFAGKPESGFTGQGAPYFQQLAAFQMGAPKATTPGGTTFIDINGSQADVQPTTTLGNNPLSVTAGSPVVTVTWPGSQAGVIGGIYHVWVLLSGATAVGGITPSGWLEAHPLDADRFTVTWTSNATATAVGGGSAVTVRPTFATQGIKNHYVARSGAGDYPVGVAEYFFADPDFLTGASNFQQHFRMVFGPIDSSPPGTHGWTITATELDLVNRGGDPGYSPNLFGTPNPTIGLWSGAFEADDPSVVAGSMIGPRSSDQFDQVDVPRTVVPCYHWNTVYSVFAYGSIANYIGFSNQPNALVGAGRDPTGHGGVGFVSFGAHNDVPGGGFATTLGSSVITLTVFMQPSNAANGRSVYIPRMTTVNGVTVGGGSYVMSNVTATTVQITGSGVATATGSGGLAQPVFFSDLMPYAPMEFRGGFKHGISTQDFHSEDGSIIRTQPGNGITWDDGAGGIASLSGIATSPGNVGVILSGQSPLLVTSAVSIGTGVGAPTLTLNGAAGAPASVVWSSNSVSRWFLQTDASENLNFYAYSAAGVFIGTMMTLLDDGSGVNFPVPIQSFGGGFRILHAEATSVTDLTNHVELYSTAAGFNVTTSPNFSLNYQCWGGVHTFYDGPTMNAVINDAGVTSAHAMQISGTTGPTWTTGSGVPSSVQPVGSIYSRVSTWAAGATLYVSKGAGAWTPVAGV